MEFRFSRKIADGILDYSLLNGIEDTTWNMSASDRAFVFVDTHHHQRDDLGVGTNRQIFHFIHSFNEFLMKRYRSDVQETY